MMKPIVRDATEDDLDAMLVLWRALEAVQRDFRVFPTRRDAERQISVLMLEAMQDPDSRALVVDGPGGLLGMAIAHVADQARDSMSDARMVELSRVVVAAEARRSGVARALIQAAAVFGRERGATFLAAKTFSGNADGRGFWDRIGFVPRYEQRVRPIEASEATDILDAEEAD